MFSLTKITITLTCFLCFCTIFPSAFATEFPQKRYVSDLLVINLKDSTKPPFKTITRVYSNDVLTILDEQDNYYKVRTAKGVEGWIAKKYTTDKTPKTIIIKGLEDRLKQFETAQGVDLSEISQTQAAQEGEDMDTLKSSLMDAQGKITELEQIIAQNGDLHEAPEVNDEDYAKLRAQYDSLQEEYKGLEQASSTVAIEEAHKELARLQYENERLQKREYLYLFLAGVCTLILGILIGSLKGASRQKRLSF